jgi:hypothetical protein
MSSVEPGELPRRPVPPPEASSASITTGRPRQFVEFDTPADHASQRVGAFPAVAPPKDRKRRPPREPRRQRIVVSVPMWVILGLAILAVIAGLLFLPTVTPWPRSPALPSADGTDPGVGVMGTGDSGAGSSAGPDAPAGSGTAASSASAPSAAATPTSTNPDGSGAPPAAGPPPQITAFSAAPLVGGLIGYDIQVAITNGATVAQAWRNVSIHISGLPVAVNVTSPPTGVRSFVANSRICLEPTDPATTTLDPDETLAISVRMTMVTLGQAPRQGQLGDSQCPASAGS